MKILELLTKYALPSTLAVVTLDGYRRQILQEYTQKRKEISTDEANRLADERFMAQAQLDSNRQILSANSLARQELEAGKENYLKILETYKTKIANKDFGDLNEDYCREIVEFLKSQVVKTDSDIAAKIKEADLKIKKMGFDPYKLYESYQKILSTLRLDQIVALFNGFLSYSLFMTCLSLALFLYADYLLDRFNLEGRYPRIAKYIKKKKKNLKALYLKIYIILIFLLLLIQIIGNIYMFLAPYFY